MSAETGIAVLFLLHRVHGWMDEQAVEKMNDWMVHTERFLVIVLSIAVAMKKIIIFGSVELP